MENTRELFQIMTRRFGLLNKNCCTAGGIDISLIQSHILYEIEHMHQPSVQQVADVLGTDITTFSRQIQSLMKMNLIKKTPHPDDRRVHVLSLTTEGKFVAATIDHQMNAYLEEVFSHMNEFEKETVIRSIKLLNASMAKSSVCCTPLG
ncbi:MarR family winged helix-turn-helix transcriptional regulator [Bacillus sp. CMF21]|uniref:MarR family winged helix-turn-helix transcriptional regulator n=1 Tax=Metabacillus dongyingensis TaxID=2874282 RepID=UPI001CC12983|nr:MarR family winged helix-turn-helix transcriptional regulator [Metabacillus dongyingensis]UAL53025.1 MarR family winged helix-turn-helix transcriptional regulator [Metabacillus dongyingensis]UOK58602.1 MarR family winged helix-turn-helix transcriptional regulator [Bacillus sp. OVS6]USK29345.1 MarR family winged helix-turn-helix transcriptional regulator [Bacillus sp. CMF21]